MNLYSLFVNGSKIGVFGSLAETRAAAAVALGNSKYVKKGLIRGSATTIVYYHSRVL
jgi:hypothetical protein